MPKYGMCLSGHDMGHGLAWPYGDDVTVAKVRNPWARAVIGLCTPGTIVIVVPLWLMTVPL